MRLEDNSTAAAIAGYVARAGEVYYFDPNHIVLYDQDAEINEEYTLVGRFEAMEDLVSAVENNPVLEGWGNQIVVIRDGE